jgi:rod shape-determining protein MreC
VKYVIISVVVFLLGYTPILKPIQYGFSYLVSPVQFGLKTSAVSIKDFFSFYANLAKINRENVKLLEDKIALESEIASLKRLKEENIILKQQLDVKNIQLKDRQLLLVDVMGNPQDPTGSSIFVNKGTESGIKKGDNVILGTFIVGIVKETYLGKSLVDLITSSSLSIAVYNIDSQTKTEGLALGRHGSSVSVERILPNELVEGGNMFITSGKDGMFLPGLYVGKVDSVNYEPSATLKSATLLTVLNIQRLDKVFILVTK